ncbi:MAG: ice-binding family protein [Aestuariivirga sp.]
MKITRFFTTAIAASTLSAFAFTTAERTGAQTLDSYGVLAGSTVTNTGPSVINGDVGASPGDGTPPSIIGFPPGIVNVPFTIHDADADAALAQSELTTTYNDLAGRPATANLTGQDLGGLVLTPGVYAFDSSAQLTGTLTLDGQGNPNAVFIFNIDSTLTTASSSTVALINGAQGGNVYFRVGSSATLGGTTQFAGQILALTTITLITGADIDCGAALARNGAVTLDTNTISICVLVAATFGDVLGPSATDNQQQVADALDDFVAGGGTLPIEFQNLLDFLSPTELAAAFTQLSGEAASSVAPTGTQAMNSLLSLVFNSGLDDDRGPGTVSVKGLVITPAGSNSSDPTELSSFNGGDTTRFWASAYGSQSNTDGDSSQGSHDRSGRSFGIAAGIDNRVTSDTVVGFAISGGRTDFDLSDGLGGGKSDMVQGVVYARTDIEDAYVAAALAYAWHGVSTERNVTLSGIDHLTAEFSAHNFAGQIETGYHIEWVTPYAALRGQAFYTPAYSERATSGSSIFALDYDENTAIMIRSELGVRLNGDITLDNGATLALRARAAWAHDYWSHTNSTAQFQALPGSSFKVEGAEPARDSLLASVGAEVRLDNGVSLASWFDGEFAENSQTYTGSVALSYAW